MLALVVCEGEAPSRQPARCRRYSQWVKHFATAGKVPALQNQWVKYLATAGEMQALRREGFCLSPNC